MAHQPQTGIDFEIGTRRVLITGATGFIGGAVARRLLADGIQVRAMARTVSKASELVAAGAEIVQGDMTDPDSLRRAVSGCGVVIHCAALLSEFLPWSVYHAVNVDGTRLLAEAALAAGVERFLHTSTIWVYGFDAGEDTDETTPHRLSKDQYIDTKIEAERIIRELATSRGLNAVIVQPPVVYGPHDSNWTMQPIQLARARQLVLANGGRGVNQPIYIDDLVAGMLAALRHGRSGESYILAGERVVTMRDYMTRLARIAGREHLPSIPRWLALTLAHLAEGLATLFHFEPPFTRTNVRGVTMHATYVTGRAGKAFRELGFLPQIELEEGIRRVEAWLRDTES